MKLESFELASKDLLLKKNSPWEARYDADVSALITRVRVTAGLTQDRLARLANTTQSSIARAESGAVLPSHPLLKKIAKAVGGILLAPRIEFSDMELERSNVKAFSGAATSTMNEPSAQLRFNTNSRFSRVLGTPLEASMSSNI